MGSGRKEGRGGGRSGHAGESEAVIAHTHTRTRRPVLTPPPSPLSGKRLHVCAYFGCSVHPRTGWRSPTLKVLLEAPHYYHDAEGSASSSTLSQVSARRWRQRGETQTTSPTEVNSITSSRAGPGPVTPPLRRAAR